MKNSRLEIRLLGPIEITYGDQPVKISRRAERGILYYLAIENRPVSRERLIDLLWPKAEQVDPRGTLRTALSRLRKNFPDKTLLVTELDQVSLDFSRCFVDLVEFSVSYHSLHGLMSGYSNHQPLPVQIVKQISNSLDLWRGDQIIEGDDFYDYPQLEAWCQGLNNDLGLQRMYLMRHLAAHYQASGQLQTALDLYIHLGRLNNQDIVSHLAVLDLLTKLGRYQEAQEFCDALEIIFEREYNAPLPEEIIQLCHESQKLIEKSATIRGQKWPISSSVQVPLVGRTAELAQLRSAFYRGGLVKIEGEMGVGKTRLMQELFETLSPKPLLILAPGRESEMTLPLAPIIHGLRRHIPHEIWKEIDGVWANQLSLLLPELAEIRTDCSPSMGGRLPSASQHLFEAIYRVLIFAANKYGRILFFLDDAQWVDRQTTAALSYLVDQGFFDKYGVFIAAIRVMEGYNSIDRLFDQEWRLHPVEVIRVNGLNPEELRNLVQHILNQPISPKFLEGLYLETRGIPFWTIEIIRHLMDTYGETKAIQDVKAFPLTKSAHTFIRSRFDQLSDDARYILNCAAIISDDISISLLQTVSGISQHDFLVALDALIQTGFLDTNPANHTSAEQRLHFGHEKLREVVLLETNIVKRQLLHQSVARELSQASDAMERAAVIAEHFKAGSDLEKAFNWHLYAAEYAWSLGAAKDANWSFQQAEGILNNAPDGILGNDQVFELFHQWSNFAYQSNQVKILEDVGGKLQQFSRKKPGGPLEGLSNLVLAMACFLWEDFETGLLLIQRAVTNLEETHHLVALIQAYSLQALFEWWTLKFDDVFTTVNRITNLAESSSLDKSFQTSAQFHAKRMMCDTYFVQGDARIALQMSQEIFEEFFSKLNSFDQWRTYNMLAHANYLGGYYKKSQEFALEGLKIAQMLQNDVVEVIALIILCKVEFLLGHLDDALQYVNRALVLAERHHKVQSIVAANMLLGDIYGFLDNTAQAIRHYRIAEVRQGYSFESFFGIENNIHLARFLMHDGEVAEARELIETILVETEQKNLMSFHAQALMIDGLIELKEGKISVADQKFSSAVVLAEQKGFDQDTMWGKFRIAQMAIQQEQYDLAEELIIKVLAFSRSRDLLMLQKYALELAGQLSKKKPLWQPLEKLQSEYKQLVEKLEANTQSEPLRQEFLNAQNLWREKEIFS